MTNLDVQDVFALIIIIGFPEAFYIVQLKDRTYIIMWYCSDYIRFENLYRRHILSINMFSGNLNVAIPLFSELTPRSKI